MKKFLIKIALRFLPCVFTAASMNRVHTGATTLWMYTTLDPIGTVILSAYFDEFAPVLNNGDTIIVSDTNVPTIDMLTVTSVSKATPVTTLNGT